MDSSYFERTEERARLEDLFLAKRKSLLLFGEEGSGKTRILRQLATSSKLALYIPQCESPTKLLTGILTAMKGAGVTPAKMRTSSSSLANMKGIIQRVLSDKDWLLVLDHVQSPSDAQGRLVKELNYYGRTPILFAGRSEHMEDIGSFRSLCIERAARFELKPWPPAVALEFTRLHAEAMGLAAVNLDEALRTFAEMGKGRPGPILAMLRMAVEPRYRHADHIKAHVVGLDYKLRGPSLGSSDMKPHS
jgi:hypothetical protein